jgi:hypothetical protein
MTMNMDVLGLYDYKLKSTGLKQVDTG